MCLPASAWQPSLCAITLSNMQSPVNSQASNYFKLLHSRGVVGYFPHFYPPCFIMIWWSGLRVINFMFKFWFSGLIRTAGKFLHYTEVNNGSKRTQVAKYNLKKNWMFITYLFKLGNEFIETHAGWGAHSLSAWSAFCLSAPLHPLHQWQGNSPTPHAPSCQFP